MKTILSAIYAIGIIGLIASYSEAQTDKNGAFVNFFNKHSAELHFDLKDQCVMTTQDEYTAYKNKELLDTDPDMTLTYPEFLNKVRDLGLLDSKYFYNPDHTVEQNIEFAPQRANAITAWTEAYEQNKTIEHKELCFLNKKEIFSLFYYTGDGYRALNRALRSNEESIVQKRTMPETRNEELEKFAIIGKHLNRALEKIKSYNGFVKRGLVLSKDPEKARKMLAEYTTGNIITFSAYTSTTIASPFPGDIQFLLKVSKNCSYVADFSMYESSRSEEEVLCKPYTKFKVINHVVVNTTHLIYLEEITE